MSIRSRYQASLVREDAYFSEVDQILLANLRETLALQQEAEEVANSGRDTKWSGRHEVGQSHFSELSESR